MPLIVKLSFLVAFCNEAVPPVAKLFQESYPRKPGSHAGLLEGCPGVCLSHFTFFDAMLRLGPLPVQLVPAFPNVSFEAVVIDVLAVVIEPLTEIPGGANVTVALTEQLTGGSGGPALAPAVVLAKVSKPTGAKTAAPTRSNFRIMYVSCLVLL